MPDKMECQLVDGIYFYDYLSLLRKFLICTVGTWFIKSWRLIMRY